MSEEQKPFEFEGTILSIDLTKNTSSGKPKVCIKTDEGTVNIVKEFLKVELKEGKRYRFAGNWLPWEYKGKKGESMWASEIGEPINVCKAEVSKLPGVDKPDYEALRTNAMATGHALSNATLLAAKEIHAGADPGKTIFKWYEILRPIYDEVQKVSLLKLHGDKSEEIPF